MQKTLIGAVAILMLVTGCSRKSGVAYELRAKFKQGEQFFDAVSVKMNITMDTDDAQMKAAMGGNTTMTMTMAMGMDTKTASVDPDGTGHLEQNIKNIKVSMNGMGQSMEFDSAKPGSVDGNNPMSQSYRGMMSKTIKSSISPLGKTEMGADVSAGDMDMTMMQMPIILPMKKVHVGDEWDFNFEMPMPNLPSKIKISGTMGLDRVEPFKNEPCAVIAMKDIRMTMADGQTQQGMKMNISGDGNIQTYLGLQSGIFHKGGGTLNLKATLTMQGKGMAMTMAMDTGYQRTAVGK